MLTDELISKYPQNKVLTDKCGKPSVMVYIKKFYLDEVIDGAPHAVHPAFEVDGKELDGIYISKFQNVIRDGLAYSLPDQDPATHIDHDTALRACASKGNGFHLMTAMEWGAIALLCQKNGFIPYGNNGMGKDIREESSVARISFYDEERTVCRTATGTGPVEWSHNGRADGIYDMNANVWEWMGGIRLVFGELQILPFNNGASSLYTQDADSDAWRAIDGTDGSFLIPNGHGTTQNSIKLDYIDGKWLYVCTDISSYHERFRYCRFADVRAHDSVCENARMLLYALCCIPTPDFCDTNVSMYANNGRDERMLFRGGRFGQGLDSGIFKSCFDDKRSYSGAAVGFRCAYYEC